MAKSIGIGLIGAGFMGRAHANAWSAVNRFFDLPRKSALHVVAGRRLEQTEQFARQWEIPFATADWHDLLEDSDVGIVDLSDERSSVIRSHSHSSTT